MIPPLNKAHNLIYLSICEITTTTCRMIVNEQLRPFSRCITLATVHCSHVPPRLGVLHGFASAMCIWWLWSRFGGRKQPLVSLLPVCDPQAAPYPLVLMGELFCISSSSSVYLFRQIYYIIYIIICLVFDSFNNIIFRILLVWFTFVGNKSNEVSAMKRRQIRKWRLQEEGQW